MTEAQSLTTSNDLYPVIINEKYEYININGEIITNEKFDKAYFFDNSMAVVSKNKKYGYINSIGNIAIPINYDNAKPFSQGVASVLTDDGYSYIDTSGTIKIPGSFKFAGDFSEGYAVVNDGNYEKSSLIDIEGNLIYEYDASVLNMGKVQNGIIYALRTYYDLKGNSLFSRNENRKLNNFSDNLVLCYVLKTNAYNISDDIGNYNYVFCDRNGNEVLGPYSYAEDFSEGLALIQIDNQYAIINTEGIVIFKNNGLNKGAIPCKYSEGFIYTKRDGKYGFLDKNGDEVIPCIYNDVIMNFKNGLALVELSENLFAYINTQNDIVYKFKNSDDCDIREMVMEYIIFYE